VFPTSDAEALLVARVLISEPHPDCRALLELVVQRAGHDPLGFGELADGDDPGLLILEPVSADGLALAHRLRGRFEELPIICTSIRPPSPATETLRPAVYLVKPFRLADLESALATALAS
jgi:DNA-binding response OmpR family regulator